MPQEITRGAVFVITQSE